MAKLLLVLAFFISWTVWTFATGGWGTAFVAWAPILGALITTQLIAFRLIARFPKDD